jgi:lipid II:glycine glycyltransferase (peptidoglycan interpeptide bridge formation enzyme)
MKILNPVPLDFWQEVAEACPWATFFHTPAWATIYAQTFPQYAIASRGFVMESGARVVIPFLAEEKKKFLKRETKLKSIEPGVYGGIIADQEISPQEVAEIIRHILKMKSTGGRIVGNPFKEFTLPSQFKKKELFTQMVDLTSGFDGIWGRFSRGQKSNISQAQRKNITIRLAQSEQDIETYFAIYLQTVKRWGKKTAAEYPQDLFLNLYRKNDPHIRFYLAEKDGRNVAGIIVLAWAKNLIYWHGCSLDEALKDYPNNLLHYAVIKWGCENGYTCYDMGPSMDMEGVVRFKSSFGAEKVFFKSYRW